MTIRNLPDYVDGGGRRQVWRPPYGARNAQLLGMVVKADRTAIDTLLDRDLNAPAGGAVEYRCAHRNILVMLADIVEMRSTDPFDSQRGFLAERELSIWCLAADRNAGERLVCYLPYIFTDSGQTVSTGREVYGYPKELGAFDAGFADIFTPTGATTNIDALAIEKFGCAAKAVPRTMVSITRKAGPGSPPVPAEPTPREEVLRNLFPGAFSIDDDRGFEVSPKPPPSATITVGSATPPARPAPPPPYARPVIELRRSSPLNANPDTLAAQLAQSPTLVFLKQFRDICCPTKACYQAIVESTISINPAGATFEPLDPALFSLTVSTYDSQPIAAELGLGPGQTTLTPDRVFLASLDFDSLTGLEVWRAPT